MTNHDDNHDSQQRSVEDLLGLSHPGDAQPPQVHSFAADVDTRPKG